MFLVRVFLSSVQFYWFESLILSVGGVECFWFESPILSLGVFVIAASPGVVAGNPSETKTVPGLFQPVQANSGVG